MRYRLTTLPTVGPGKVTEELDRLLKNAKRLTTSLVVVGPPHKRLPMTATLLEVPDPFAQMATRVLEVILGPSGQFEPLLAVTTRDEWAKHALLVPRKGAQPLVESLFEGWSSACLHLHWRMGRCVGIIHYCEGDAARVAALASRGWKARPVPAKAADALAAARLTPTWMSRVTHQPFLGKPLVTPTPQSALAPTSGGKSITPTSLFSEPQESVFHPGSTGAAPRKMTQARPTAVGTVLAPSGADGFPLGTTLDGQAVKLAWHALLLSVAAPEDRQRDLALTLITRAIGHDLGLIAVIPQSLVTSRQLAAWSARVRTLDPRNLWESHAIPWHLIDPLLLREALSAAGVQTPASAPLPTTFGEFLSSVPGGEQYCTESVLALTAPEGDDLRGVVEAGGGVLLVDDASPGGRLLAMLLFALLSTDPPIDRRMLIIRPAQIGVPAALAQRAIQVVFGEDAAALGTLRALSDSWRLTHADGSPATELDADLDRPPSALDESSYGTLMNTLDGKTEEQASGQADAQPLISTPANGLLDDDGDDLFATPFAASAPPAQPALAEDDLFTGSLNLSSPFGQAAPAAARAPGDDLFAFDSVPATSQAPQPAAAGGGAFNSFFDMPLDGDTTLAPEAPAADLGGTTAHDNQSFAASAPVDLGDFAPSYGSPAAAPAADDGAFGDIFAQPLDGLTPAPWQDGAAAADVTSPATASGGDDLSFDMFTTPLDFGGTPATTADAATPAPAFGGDDLSFDMFATPLDFGSTPATAADGNTSAQPFVSGIDLSSAGSIFPTLSAEEPWGLGASFDAPPAMPAADLAQEQTWGAGMAGDSADVGGVFYLPTDAEAAAPPEMPDVQIVPAEFQGWQAAPEAMASWTSAPWLGVEETDTAARAPAADTVEPAASAAEEAAAPVEEPAAVVEPLDEGAAAETAASASQPRASFRHWTARRHRRLWRPANRATIEADASYDEAAAAEEPAERPGEDVPDVDLAPVAPELALIAQPGDEDDLPPDDLTLALAQGDLDLTSAPSFDGPEFALPPVDATIAATDEPQLWTGDQAPVAADALRQPDAQDSEPGTALDQTGAFDFASFGDTLPVLEQDQPALALTQAAALPTPVDDELETLDTRLPDWFLASLEGAGTGDQAPAPPTSLDLPGAFALNTSDGGLLVPGNEVAASDEAPAAAAADAGEPMAAPEQTAPADQPAAPMPAEQRAPAAPPIAPPAFPALYAAMPRVTALAATPDALAFDDDAVYAAWRAGAGMAELIELVARANPTADRSLIRRAIRALLDTRTAAGATLPAAPVTPLWSTNTPAVAAWNTEVATLGTAAHAPQASFATLDTAGHAPLAPVSALDTRAHAPQTPQTVLDTPTNGGMPATVQFTGANSWTAAMSSDEAGMLDTAAHAPQTPQTALDTAGHAPQASFATLDTAAHDALTPISTPDMPAATALPDRALEDTVPLLVANDAAPLSTPMVSAITASPLPVLDQHDMSAFQSPTLASLDMAAPLPDADDLFGDEQVWARWTAGEELTDIIRALCGYTRGRAADEARDRVYRVVVPRIVAELDADVLVTRLLDGRQPLRSQVPQLDELLKRMNRQAGPVTGVIRDKTIARLIASMREARAYAHTAT